jgi:hypothetical protein
MTTMTFRLDAATRHKLRAKASRLSRSESDLLREMIERELEEKPIGSRAGHLKGSLSLPPSSRDHWRPLIRKRNWRR